MARIKKPNRLYKDKYCISAYSTDGLDELICSVDNAEQFAKYFDLNICNARAILSRRFTNQTIYMRYKNNLYEIYFIELN